jgi:LmbE family N-acetylglucosaminyl deacetylase
MRRRLFATALALLPVLLAVRVASQVQPPVHDRGASGLGLALRRLGVTGGVLYVTAHPDDENNAVLVMLSRERGLPVSLLTLTRGEGGQNEIGTELFEALGVLRTEELLGVHRYDGASQFFTRAYEFGYSFSVEETFEKWGQDEILKDVVRVVRARRPDVILTQALEARGGGQHHQAAARLAREAFRAAADPARYPEQIAEGLRPWQARKIYQGGTGGGGLEAPGRSAPAVSQAVGGFDPLLGMTVLEFGSLARSSHRCQGQGQLKAPPGEYRTPYSLMDAQPAVSGAESDILEGVDTSLAGLVRFASADGAGAGFLPAGLAAVADGARRAQSAFDGRAPERTLAPLREGLGAVRALIARVKEGALSDGARYELLPRLAAEEDDFERALVLAHGLSLEPQVDDGNAVPGQAVVLTTRLFNAGPEAVAVDDVAVEVPSGWTVTARGETPRSLAAGEGVTLTHAVTVAPNARPTQPYWKRNPKVDRYDLLVPEHQTLPWSPPDLTVALAFRSGAERAVLRRPAYARLVGQSGGERQKVLNVVPALDVRVEPAVAVFARGGPERGRELRVRVRNETAGEAAALLHLEVPPGFQVEPKEARLAFRFEAEELTARFLVKAPAALPPGPALIEAVAERDGRAYREGYQVVLYDHIQERHLFQAASSSVLALDVAVAEAVQVGYVRGAGDDVPQALAQLGVAVTFLEAEDLAFGDLSRFGTIVTGIRAYQTRPDLRANHHRLMEYAREGGHLVVQHNRAEFNSWTNRPGGAEGDSPFAPYPARVTTNRVSAEDAPVQLLVPGHALLTTPNRIGPADFSGWVQERGVYFLDARDPRYVELLASTDPFPENPGVKKGLLVDTPVGRGSWTYVGLGLYRQIAAGVPGAYRLLANLVSRPRER